MKALAIGMCLAGLLGLIMAVRRRALGPLLLAATMLPLSVLLLLRGNPYADAKVLVLVAIVAPLFAMCAAVWLFGSDRRGLRILGGVLGVVVTGSVLAGNALAYHDVQLAPYDRYEEQISIAEQLDGKGPVVFAEYDEFAKHFMRRSQVLSQPEWPFEFPINKLNVKGAAAHVEKNRDGLHPSFKSPLDPDGITPSSLEAASYIVLRRSPTASRPPSNYRLVRRGRYYEVWKRDSSQRVVFHKPLGRTVFAPEGRPRCGDVRKLAQKAERVKGGRLAWAERPPVTLYDPEDASSNNKGFGFSERVTYQLYPRTVTVGGTGAATARITVPKTGLYQVWVMGSFGRETSVSVDGRPAGSVAYEIANSGVYVALHRIRLTAGAHELKVARGGGNLRPGNGGGYRSNLLNLGPVVLSPVEADRRTVNYTAPKDYAELCSKKRLDWIEVVKPAA